MVVVGVLLSWSLWLLLFVFVVVSPRDRFLELGRFFFTSKLLHRRLPCSALVCFAIFFSFWFRVRPANIPQNNMRGGGGVGFFSIVPRNTHRRVHLFQNCFVYSSFPAILSSLHPSHPTRNQSVYNQKYFSMKEDTGTVKVQHPAGPPRSRGWPRATKPPPSRGKKAGGDGKEGVKRRNAASVCFVEEGRCCATTACCGLDRGCVETGKLWG